MKRFVRFLLLGLVLVLVAMASALTAMRFAIHGREVQVPKLVGLSVSDAENAANSLGLLLVVENKFYSTEIPAGSVVSQSPSPGSQVRRGWRVRVAESMGQHRADIPNVTGQSSRAAEINASRRGLQIESIAVARIPDAVGGQVIGQSPPAHADAVISPKISLLLAAPEMNRVYIMPNFVGKHLADAAAAVEEAGMRLDSLPEAASTSPGSPAQKKSMADGTIILKQVPAPGQKIAVGDTVRFEVSR
jgi:eukaryotic-like serine/threonine-protein kinase